MEKFDAHNEIHNAGNRVISYYQTKIKDKDEEIAKLREYIRHVIAKENDNG